MEVQSQYGRFNVMSKDAKAFFDEHGFVVLESIFTAEECEAMIEQSTKLIKSIAASVNEEFENHISKISQWRDIWKHNEYFRKLLHDTRVWENAAWLMDTKGARLLHDHLIFKPKNQSQVVPWHQDFMYWPVNTSKGLSFWIPMQAVGVNGGCLEVLDGSHKLGEHPPSDFMNDLHNEFDSDPRLVKLPATSGSIVVLHSLTWHKTGPNCDNLSENSQRRAYISLWLPPSAKFAPQHSDWHPVIEHVTVKKDEVLNDDWFPLFGQFDAKYSNDCSTFEGPDYSKPITMFNASRVIGTQLKQILEHGGMSSSTKKGIKDILSDLNARKLIADTLIEKFNLNIEQQQKLEIVCQNLHDSSIAWDTHRARNVYNEYYVDWWQLVGEKWWLYRSNK